MREAFGSGPLGALDARRGIHREVAFVGPGAHFGGVIALDQAVPDEGAHDTGANPCLHADERRRVKAVKLELPTHASTIPDSQSTEQPSTNTGKLAAG